MNNKNFYNNQSTSDWIKYDIYNFIYLIIKMGDQNFTVDLEDFKSKSDSDQEPVKTVVITIFLILKYFPVLISKIIFFQISINYF